MDILKAEIERKKRQLADSKLVDPARKYFRRGDLVQQQVEEYRRHCGLQEASAPSTAPERGSGADDDADDSTPQLARYEVIRRLRERGEPVTLFGESETDAFKRLRRLEILEPEVNRGMRNDFQAAMEQVDAAYLAEVLEQQSQNQTRDDSEKPDGAGSVPEEAGPDEEDQQTMEQIKAEAEGKLGLGDNIFDTQLLLKLFKCLLAEWGEKIQHQPRADKESMKNKMGLAIYKQTQQYLRPLFRQLRLSTLPEDIRESLVEIAGCLLDRNYLKANDTYLQMAIGNAAWPIGVTMVGIHARTGREKIFSKHVAHVMNDETQRKFIQGLKRLMTKCQEYYPTDPSRSVEYGGLTEVRRQPTATLVPPDDQSGK